VTTQRDDDSGFTLVELLVVMALLGMMMAIALSGWTSWTRASAHSGAAREMQSLMRMAQQQAVTEGRASCVLFDVGANDYSLYRGACGDTARTLVRGPMTAESAVVFIADPSFSGTVSSGVTFYARGTATPGTVKVKRTGSAKEYKLSVEGLTGRVSLR
jgi:type II secretion system protein H